jgi:hypothetical protein
LPKAYGVVPFVKTLKQPSSSPQLRNLGNLDLKRLITSVKSKRIAKLEKKEKTRTQNRAIQEQRFFAKQASQSPILSQSKLNDGLKGIMKIQKILLNIRERGTKKSHLGKGNQVVRGQKRKQPEANFRSHLPV